MTYAYKMDFIADKDVYKAVMFACNLLKQGNSYEKAVGVACRYYGTNPEEVRHYISQRSGRKRANTCDFAKKKGAWKRYD